MPSTVDEVHGRRRVLIADDDDGLRATMTEIVTDAGYAVLQARDGVEGLDVLQHEQVDVLVVDLAMPRMNGVEVVERLDPPPPVVIVCSAFAYFHPDQVRQLIGPKLFGVLTKPVPPARLVAVIDDAVRHLDEPDPE